MDCLMITAEDTRVYKDHINLFFIFRPHTLNTSVAEYVVSNVQRCIFPLKFQFCSEHIAGGVNELENMMTRRVRGIVAK